MQTTANLWEVLCRDLESQRQTARAEQYHEIAEKFLAAARQVLRANSPKMCDAIEIAGDICQASGHRREAIENFREALNSSLAIGVTTSAARVAAKLALLLDQMGEVREARQAYESALSLYEQSHDHSQHTMLLSQLGALRKRSGDVTGAIEAYERAMEVAMALHGDTHPEVSAAANNLGVAYIEARNFDRAESLHMQALATRERCYGATHPEVAQSMANLAVVYHSTGQYDKAEAFYSGALKIYKRFRGSDDAEMQTVQANYDSLLAKLGRPRS